MVLLAPFRGRTKKSAESGGIPQCAIRRESSMVASLKKEDAHVRTAFAFLLIIQLTLSGCSSMGLRAYQEPPAPSPISRTGLASSTVPRSPCEDPHFIELSQRPLDELTAEELEHYRLLSASCLDWQSRERTADRIEAAADRVSMSILLGSLIIVGGNAILVYANRD